MADRRESNGSSEETIVTPRDQTDAAQAAQTRTNIVPPPEETQVVPNDSGRRASFELDYSTGDAIDDDVAAATGAAMVDFDQLRSTMEAQSKDDSKLDVPLHHTASTVSTASDGVPLDEAYVPKKLKTVLGKDEISQLTVREFTKRVDEQSPETPPGDRRFGVPERESRVLVLYTGGTIGMCTRNGVYKPEPNYLLTSLHSLPYLNDDSYIQKHYPKCDPRFPKPMCLPPVKYVDKRIVYWLLEYEPLLDSSDMTFDDWIRIAKDIKKSYNRYDGFVVLHGTDTLAYTASALSFMFEYLGKPVVLTGAQIPVCEVRSDGQENFIGALIVAGSMDIPEVCIYFNNKLLRGNRCSKVDNSALNAFHSPNIEPLVLMEINFKVDHDSIFRSPDVETFKLHTALERNVVVLRIFPSMPCDVVRAAVAPPTMGVVLQTFGSGNMSSRRLDIIQVLKQAVDRGCVIVNCSQCVRGEVDIHYATGQVLADIGVIGGSDMTVEAALTKLSYVLGKDWPIDYKRKMMRKNLRGELTLHVGPKGRHTAVTLPELDVLPRLIKFLGLSSATEVNALRDALAAPLACAASVHNDVAALKSLHSGGVKLNLTDYDLRSPLHVAAHCGARESIEFLLKHGLNVHSRDRWDLTPLQCAIQGRHFAIIETLISHGANLGHLHTTTQGMELCQCVARGDTDGLTAWRLAGASINEKDDVGRTPMHVAAAQLPEVAVPLLKWLVANGADLHVKDKWGRTPLLIAVTCRVVPSIDLIRSAGGHIDWPLVRLGVELCSCAADADIDGLSAFVRAGVDLNTADYDGRTALHVATARNSLTVVKYLLQQNVDRFRCDNFGHTALMDAQQRNFVEIVAALTTSTPS